MDNLMFILATSGCTYIITQSFLFKPLRDLFYLGDELYEIYNKAGTKPGYKVYSGYLNLDGPVKIKTFFNYLRFYIYELLTCALCTGFWVGILMYYVMFIWKIDLIVYGCISSIVSMVVFKFIAYLAGPRKILQETLPPSESTISDKTSSSERTDSPALPL